MASSFFAGEKASREDARKSLMEYAAEVFDGKYTVKFQSDDGGNHITLIIEVEDPSAQLDKHLSDSLGHVKWEGWRHMVLKVPIGYIDTILEAPRRD